ncbi:MAG: ABC transporter ATP-binding protein [Mogibacterium sp.]|nr:ABC transporter ATP-binding protein [Mogibacterium sp.]
MYKLETKNLSMSFDGVRIIDDISIYVGSGELVSLLGLSGSGKTTLFNCIAGIYRPAEGSVIMDGRDITGETGHLAYMLQKDLLLQYYTIEDNVALPLVIRGRSRKEARAAVQEYFPEFGLEGYQKKYPSQLSGGMRQRAALLRTYMFSESMALLDEPFSALDAITKSSIHEWYLEIMEKIDLSTIFITHDIDEAILLSDRIYIMQGRPGRIEGEIHIDPPRRDRAGFELTSEFLAYKKQIVGIIGA